MSNPFIPSPDSLESDINHNAWLDSHIVLDWFQPTSTFFTNPSPFLSLTFLSNSAATDLVASLQSNHVFGAFHFANSPTGVPSPPSQSVFLPFASYPLHHLYHHCCCCQAKQLLPPSSAQPKSPNTWRWGLQMHF